MKFTMGDEGNTVPSYGWSAKLDYQFPQKRSQYRLLNFQQIRPMIMLTLRYILQYIYDWWKGKTPVMDYVHPASCDQQSGVPLGGIGGGTIGRGFRGEFSRFQMIPGVYEYPSTTVEAAQFIVNIQDEAHNTLYQKVLSCQRKPKSKLSSWEWDFPGKDAEYTALYPRSWTVFNIPQQKIKLICRQISPIIPNNYKDSSIPGAVFVWKVQNYSNVSKNVSITFTFESGIGFKHDKTNKIQTQTFDKASVKSNICGISIRQEVNNQALTYGIASLKKEGTNASSLVFDPNGDGKTLWSKLKKDGELDPFTLLHSSDNSGNIKIACALCNRTTVNSNGSSSIIFSLAWDNPVIQFPDASTIRKRFYTKYFGDSGNAASDICLYCVDNYGDWESCIEAWQAPILENKNLPDWYKSALFNELYYVSDGGSIWLLAEDENLSKSDPRREFGKFCYLEGHEYRMCNTYDVHYYASFALILLWPKLQLSIQYDIKDTIVSEDKTVTWFLYNGVNGYKKVKNTVPHDLGDPREDPFTLINSYDIHDVSNWKDLSLKFVLQVYRDYVITGDINYVHDMFPQALIVMNHALTWGTKEDGMIKNSGFPDQTYDAWTMSGISSYCGSLWIAALVVFIRLAKLMNETKIATEFASVLSRAQLTFEQKLWTGEYYSFDSSGGSHSSSIMADQLCGLWYLHCCDINEEIFPSQNVKKALSHIYKMNVCNYYNGEQGAVNGMLPNGCVDKSAIQSEEVWTGVTYSLASLLIFEGFLNEGLTTAEGLYETIYEKNGLGFATPEAIIGQKSFRALSYMRPLSIWSMQLAIDRQQKLLESYSCT